MGRNGNWLHGNGGGTGDVEIHSRSFSRYIVLYSADAHSNYCSVLSTSNKAIDDSRLRRHVQFNDAARETGSRAAPRHRGAILRGIESECTVIGKWRRYHNDVIVHCLPPQPISVTITASYLHNAPYVNVIRETELHINLLHCCHDQTELRPQVTRIQKIREV